MKNVLFWIGVKSDNADLIKLKEYGDWTWFEYSKLTWQHWCKRHGIEFVHYDTPSNPDTFNHLVNWQRWFDVFNILDERGIDYDQIILADASTMAHWNAPNFFELSEHKWCSFRANENMKWSIESTDGYQDLFPDTHFAYNDYIASGFVIFNKSHRSMLEELYKFYTHNYESILSKQRSVKRGTDQPVLNYFLRKHNVDINYLRLSIISGHLYRKEMLGHNWQLNENFIPFFIKYADVWSFSGLPNRGAARSELMGQTWNLVKRFYDDNFVLNKVKHKESYVKTTTYKFKQDLLTHLNGKGKVVLELGCCRGDTSRVLAEIFDKVIAVDISFENIADAKSKYGDIANIEFITADVYNNLEYPDRVDAVLIDASHEMSKVYEDIKNISMRYNNPIIILDDFGNGDDIRTAVLKAEQDGYITISRYIGENAGYQIKRLNGQTICFTGAEGVICNL